MVWRFDAPVSASLRVCVAVTLAAWSAAAPLTGQSGAPNGEWTTYGGDLANTPIRAARSDRRRQLQRSRGRVAVQDGNLGPRPEFNFQSTPLMVTVWSTRRREPPGGRGAGRRRPAKCSGCTACTKASAARLRRGALGPGLAYWTDGTATRIVYVTRLSDGRARREDRDPGRRGSAGTASSI